MNNEGHSALTASPLVALVTKTALRRSFGTADPSRCGPSAGKCRLRLVGGHLYRGKACNLRRPNIQLLSAMLISALSRHPPIASEAELCLFQGANPAALKVPAGMAPILQWCTLSSDVLSIPTPYEADCVYKHRYAFTLAHHRRLLANTHEPPPRWEEKRPLAVWRGACTGSASLYSMAGASMRRLPPRARLSHLSTQHPDLIDAVLFPCARCASLWRRQPSLFGNASQALTDADYAKYKYILDLDGDGCSGRLSKLLYSGSVVLKSWGGRGGGGGGYPFYYHALKPWKHFVPIAADLSDLVERLHWLKSHDEEARDIARRASEFARLWLSPEAIDGYTYALLVGLAELQRARSQKHETEALESSPASKAAKATVQRADLELNFDLIHRAGDGDGGLSYINMTDHKERTLSVRCPASEAPPWMLPVDSATELAQEYLDAAAHALRPVSYGGMATASSAPKRGREAALRAAARGYKLRKGVWMPPRRR